MSGAAGAATGATGAAGAAGATPWGAIASTGLSIGTSLFQASQQGAEARYQQSLQDKAMAEAKKQAGANFMKNIGVPLQGQMEAMKQNTAAYKQALEAGSEGDIRNIQGVVGRVNESVVDANAKQANEIDDRLYNLHMAQAQEMKDSANSLAGISLGEAEGAGLAKQQAEKAQTGAYTSALEGVAGLGAIWDNTRSLYPTQKAAQSVAPYSEANDPLLNSIKNNAPAFGPQNDMFPGLTAFRKRGI